MMNASRTQPASRARSFSLAGAVAAALAASACCIGPLVVALLGVGGAGAFAVLGAYRPYILGATLALLGLGFYLTYRPAATSGAPAADSDACGSCQPKRARTGRVALWLATGLVVLFAAIPPVLARISHAHGVPTDESSGGTAVTAVIHVEGIDCEACAGPIREALSKVGGFRNLMLDIPAQAVSITYEPAPGRLAAYAAAISALGYETSLPATAPATEKTR